MIRLIQDEYASKYTQIRWRGTSHVGQQFGRRYPGPVFIRIYNPLQLLVRVMGGMFS